MTLQNRELFGGAITMAIPGDFLDASDMRQVPNNQEVFLSPTSDTAAIVEILTLVTEDGADTDLWDAAKFHFNSVAHDNASLSSKILTPSPGRIAPAPQVAASAEGLVTPTPVTLVGTQVVHKFSHNASGAPRPGHEGDAPDEVWIGLALWRVEVTVGGHAKKADVVVTCNVHANAENGTDEVAKTQKWLEDAVKTFKIVNWGLFADE